ncbi:MAG TPA: hypothetical protein VH436_04985, partial [Vicinamibacterales bacterium]
CPTVGRGLRDGRTPRACPDTLTFDTQGLLYNTKPLDASSYAAAAAAMLVIALSAAAIPALRAARVDPITALREG